jgi:hypothetical protein
MSDEDRELLRETLEVARELLKVFREYEPLLKRLRSPVKPPWSR